jgi:putative transposase
VPKKKEANEVRRKYEFIKANHGEHDLRMMCRLLGVARSGYYAWLKNPMSDRAKEDARLLRLIRASFTASQGVYGLCLAIARVDISLASRLSSSPIW